MGNIGSTELLVIFILALLLLGPKRLPEVGESLGKMLRRFRQASRELRDELDVRHDLDVRRDLDIRNDIRAVDKRSPQVEPARDTQARGAEPPVESTRAPDTASEGAGAGAPDDSRTTPRATDDPPAESDRETGAGHG
jgi:Tat protein translocase TatB subunit